MRLPCLFLLSLLALPLPGADGSATAAAAAPAAPPRVALVPIEGMIDEHRASQFERAMTQALADKPDIIVVHITTDGGRVDSAEEILKRELKVEAPTRLVAFIDNRAFSAGALISFGCSRIYMTSDATIGDIGVIFLTGDSSEPIKYAPEKLESPMRALLRQVGQHNGWDEAKLQKMTARNQELWRFELAPGEERFVIEDDLPRVLSENPGIHRDGEHMLRGEDTVGFMVAGKDRLLTYTAKEAVAEHMATALVADLDGLYRVLGVEPSQVKSYVPSSQERLAETLAGWAPLLAGLAVLFLILEFKVPSGGLWLIGAAVCGVAFLVTQYWLQLVGAPEIILIGLGVAAVVLELFVLPTGGLLGIGGLVAMGLGLVLAFMPDGIQFNPSAEGWGTALGSALQQSLLALVLLTVGIAIAIVALPRTRAMRVLASPAAIEGSSAGSVESAAVGLVGRRGMARSELRPTGYVAIDGKDMAATTEHGSLVEAGAEVEVVDSRFGELVVRPVAGQVPA